ncbi:MAG: hypothetical protein KAR83_07480, partial [Thermodesulfovibrionales bacterium]|nr:hypothetical protein [Thermodesulfovibrionales bacterium]
FHLIETDQRCFSVFEMDFMFEKKRIRMHDFGFTIEEQDVVEDPVWPGYMMLGSPVTTMTSLGRAMYDVVDSALGVIRGTSEVVCTVEDAYQAQRVCAALAEDFIAGDQTE